DTGSLDTGSLDTGSLDTGSFDTGPLDGGPACPAPPSTSMPSGVDSLTCEEIKTKLPAAVADAKRCNCDADCSKEVWRDACKCTTFVNPGQEATPLVIALMKRWSDKLCTTICPLAACPAPTKATCVPDPGGGSFKVCKDG
ncbi:MAG: hypothetical protein K1X94_34605, partial [Sandaracinaceae bacterium]|nr:hypothetical protein [Sandaracinaceae bacterium]